MTAVRTLVMTVMIGLPSGLAAQSLEITPFGGYQVGGKLQIQEGDFQNEKVRPKSPGDLVNGGSREVSVVA